MAKKSKRVVDPNTEVEFMELPGGTLQVGLSATERKQLAALIGDDEDGVVDELPRARKVKVAPFRVARMPLDSMVVATAGVGASDSFGSPHAHVTAKDAAKIVAALGYRLLTEDEWEYVARGGGANAWLADPNKLLSASFGKRGAAAGWKKNAFGVDGLGWGTWVKPAKGSVPSLAGGGGLRSMPWQSRGEVAMVHASFRTKSKVAPLLVAWDGEPSAAKRPTKTDAKSFVGDIHTATQLRFVDVPGGTFQMGIDKKERARIAALLPEEHRAAFEKVAAQCPPRTVTVAPFRCATTPVTVEMSKRLGSEPSYRGDVAHNSRKVTDKWAKRFGLRIVTEEEWEFIARDGGVRGWAADLERYLPFKQGNYPPVPANAFGITNLEGGCYVGDKGVTRSMSWAPYDVEDVGSVIARLRHTGDEWAWSGALFVVA